MKKQLIRATAVTVLGLSLTTGFAAADINKTGPDSTNTIDTSIDNEYDVDNDNDLTVGNTNVQTATSGEAESRRSTEAGDATSGDAENDSEFAAEVSVENGSDGAGDLFGGWGVGDVGSIENTGPDSTNEITYEVDNDYDVENDNDLTVTNTNVQTATSGDATVERNTSGGSATTGSVSNTSSSSVVLTVKN